MDQRIFHGNLSPADIAQALLGEFNRGNLVAQALEQSERMAVQIATRPGSPSGGQTAMTITLQRVPDGVMVQIGQQAWLGTAASLGATALATLRNPFNLLGRLDDLAQDVENLTMSDRIWKVIERAAQSAGATHELSDRLNRLTCEYCGSANPVGEASCLACGAPLGDAHPTTCRQCGYVVGKEATVCPNCKNPL